MSDSNGKYLMFRGKPLVRDGQQICWGDMKDKYVLVLGIMSTKKAGDKEVPDQVLSQSRLQNRSLRSLRIRNDLARIRTQERVTHHHKAAARQCDSLFSYFYLSSMKVTFFITTS